MEEKLASKAFDYGAVGVAALIFVVGLVILWRQYTKGQDKIAGEREAMVKERASWELTEAKIRAECVQAIAATQAAHTEQIIKLNNAMLDREDKVRAEFADLMEQVANKAGEQSVALTNVLQKFYERFVGPRPRY